MESLIGRTLDGKYRIGRLIGRGGMGSVYRGEHLGTGRPVAVKTILPRLVTDVQAVERFRREARAAGSLRHPNIVDVTDFGVARVGDHDVAYLVMEYLEGRTLRALLDEAGPLGLELVVEIVEQAAMALDAAHARGIVHRDLKPDNIWLVPDPRGGYAVRLLDFGIAALLGAGPAGTGAAAAAVVPRDPEPEAVETVAGPAFGDAWQAPAAVTDEGATRLPGLTPSGSPRLTSWGDVLGTPAYMSPEQCCGAAVDARSDIYSLGIVAWQALAGRRPFEGSASDLARRHLKETPPRVHEVNPAVPPRVGDAIAAALAKKPAERYATAGAMAGSIRVASEGPTVVLRRSMALYLERFAAFSRIAVRSATPVLAILALEIVALPLAWWGLAALTGNADTRTRAAVRAAGVMGVTLAGWFLWLPLTTMHHAVFASVVEWLRTRPLDALDLDRVLSDVRRRIGLEASAGLVRTNARLVGYYVKAEWRGRAGQGDLAFQIAFHEGRGSAEIRDRCLALARATKRSYDWIRVFIFATLVVPAVVEGSLAFSAGLLLGIAPGNAFTLAISVASLLVPVNATLLNPGVSTSLAVLYFRARQALGENVGFSAVMPSRL